MDLHETSNMRPSLKPMVSMFVSAVPFSLRTVRPIKGRN
jgi:hypothetical protein